MWWVCAMTHTLSRIKVPAPMYNNGVPPPPPPPQSRTLVSVRSPKHMQLVYEWRQLSKSIASARLFPGIILIPQTLWSQPPLLLVSVMVASSQPPRHHLVMLVTVLKELASNMVIMGCTLNGRQHLCIYSVTILKQPHRMNE